MKTKFTQIVKFKKQAVDNIELELAKVNNSINQTLAKIDDIQHSLNELQTPNFGTFFELRGYQGIFNAHMLEIGECKKVLESLKMKKNQIELKLKSAYLEYEKMKHLDDVQKGLIIKELKRKEQEDLNEISVMLFNNNKNS